MDRFERLTAAVQNNVHFEAVSGLTVWQRDRP